MERVLAELLRRMRHRYDVVVVASDLAADLRPLVAWRRVKTPRRPAILRLGVFYLVGGVRLARLRVDLVVTLGAIVPNRADVASVHFCHAGFRRATSGLAPVGAPLLRRINTGLSTLACLAAERWSYRPTRTRLLMPVSHGVARELALHYPGVPIEVAPNGVDRARFRSDKLVRREVRDWTGVADDELVALFVGGDWDRKGLALAIEGIARATKTDGHPVHLWVVGSGDELRFGALARELEVGDRVHFFGPRRDAYRFYSGADVFVFPTSYEAFPLVALEAAAAGLPLVASLVSGVEDLIGDGQAGIPVDRGSEAIGAALVRLAQDGALRRRLSTAARARSAAFTWSRSTGKAMAAFDRLLPPREVLARRPS